MGKATRIDAGGYGRGGNPLKDSQFSSHDRTGASGDGKMLEDAVAASVAGDAARGWSVVSEGDGETYVHDINLTLERAGELRDWLGSANLRTYRIETDERAAALEAAGSGAPESEVLREIEIAVRRREEAKWGRSTADIGGKAPNGERFDSVNPVAPGIDFLGTPGHGFYSLSAERNMAVAPALRNRNGKYEEDCEQYIVAWTFPEAFLTNDHGSDAQGVRNWFPDGWEKATGQTLTPGESRSRDEATWTATHSSDYVVTSADSDGDGHVIVNARAGESGDVKRFRVDKHEYDTGGFAAGELGRSGRFVISLDRHEEMAIPARTLTPVPQYTGINIDGATPAARKLIEKDLRTRVRGGGTIATVIADGLSGKGVYVNDSGKREYYLCLSQNREDTTRTYAVTKATWNAVEAPDSRTLIQKIAHDIHALEPALEKAQEDVRNSRFSGFGSGRSNGAREALAKLEAKRAALSEQYAAATAAAAAEADR